MTRRVRSEYPVIDEKPIRSLSRRPWAISSTCSSPITALSPMPRTAVFTLR